MLKLIVTVFLEYNTNMATVFSWQRKQLQNFIPFILKLFLHSCKQHFLWQVAWVASFVVCLTEVLICAPCFMQPHVATSKSDLVFCSYLPFTNLIPLHFKYAFIVMLWLKLLNVELPKGTSLLSQFLRKICSYNRSCVEVWYSVCLWVCWTDWGSMFFVAKIRVQNGT